MLEGYVDFFMDPSLAECYVKLKEELNKLLQKKVSFPKTSCSDSKRICLSVHFIYYFVMVPYACAVPQRYY